MQDMTDTVNLAKVEDRYFIEYPSSITHEFSNQIQKS